MTSSVTQVLLLCFSLVLFTITSITPGVQSFTVVPTHIHTIQPFSTTALSLASSDPSSMIPESEPKQVETILFVECGMSGLQECDDVCGAYFDQSNSSFSYLLLYP